MATIEVIDDFDKELKPRSQPQVVFASIPDEVKERNYGGAAGGGKTFSIVCDPLFKGCHNIYGFQGRIFRRSFSQIEESLWPEMQKWYPRFGFVPNVQNHSWKHPRTKATIATGFIDRDSEALKHDSAAYDYLGFEELCQFNMFPYVYLLHRNRPNVANWRAYCASAATPGDIGNKWVRERFIEPSPSGYRVIRGIYNGKPILRMHIPAKAKDNPVLMARDPEYIHQLEMLPEALRRAKLLGDWWAFQGQVFDEFRTYHHPDEPEHAVHVINSYPGFTQHPTYGWLPPDWWPKIICIDWGYVHGNVVQWGAVSPKGELIIYREYVTHLTAIKIWGAHAAMLSQYDGNIRRVICDSVVFDRLGAERTLAEQIVEATGWVQLEPSDKDRIGQKILLHELFRWKERPKSFEPVAAEKFDPDYAQKLLRIKGVEAYKAYTTKFISDNTSEILPKFKIFDSCPVTIDAIQSAVYDEGTKNKKAEDIKKVDGDDALDCLKYLCKGYEQYIENVDNEFKKRAEMESVISDVQRTGDYNTFYNRLAIMERKDSDPVRSSRRMFKRHSRVIH